MKHFRIIGLLFLLITNYSVGQNKELDKRLTSIENEWTLDAKGILKYTKVVEAKGLTKDEITARALKYLNDYYGGGKTYGIRTKNSADVHVIRGSGIYDNIHTANSKKYFGDIFMDCWHEIKIDVMDQKARIVITFSNYTYSEFGNNGPDGKKSMKITSVFPINKKDDYNIHYGRSFYNSHKTVQWNLHGLQHCIVEGVHFKPAKFNEPSKNLTVEYIEN